MQPLLGHRWELRALANLLNLVPECGMGQSALLPWASAQAHAQCLRVLTLCEVCRHARQSVAQSPPQGASEERQHATQDA